ncbi:transcriptional regulator GcvA [Shinella sp.]|uniref:transcriptional regulator GcvA n=1 Tax=unclassified Shinella TaxID=2643062 RepID=UPI0028AC30EF|nr:transcriptional regulator GcvA [Shinella sp.]
MRRIIPALPSLSVFEASARHGSFTRASEELNMTQSAVSKRVANLEAYVGTQLFERIRKRIVLTEAGEQYLSRIREALNIVEQATVDARAYRSGEGVLNIATLPSFGNRWLFPRIGRFTSRYPHISLNVTARQWPFDVSDEGIDVAIFYSSKSWQGGHSEVLMGEEVVPVCAPGLIPGASRFALKNVQLLHHRARPRAWQQWLDLEALDDINAYKGSRFEQFDMIIKAAVSGAGVGLVPVFMVQDEIAQRSLVTPFARKMKSDESYFLISPNRKRSTKAVAAFRDWIFSEVESQRDA